MPPRCKNGTRRNKKTGNCEPVASKKQTQPKTRTRKVKEVDECPICVLPMDNKKELIKTKCGHTYHKICLAKTCYMTDSGCPLCRANIDKECYKLRNVNTINENEIEKIIDNYNLDDREEYKEDKKYIREKLPKVKYDPKYRGCFDGKKINNIYGQLRDKVSCYMKYRHSIK